MILWIGGVATVTLVILPAVRRFKDPAEGIALFERMEGRFAWQARAWTLLVGARFPCTFTNLQPEDFRGLTPLFYSHITPYGEFNLV